MKILVKENTLGICLEGFNNLRAKCYKPGTHLVSKWKNIFYIDDSLSLAEAGLNVDKVSCPDYLINQIEKIIVPDGCFMIRYVNNVRKGVYKTGTHYFLKSNNTINYDMYTKDNLEIEGLSLDTIRALLKEGLVSHYIISENTAAILYINGVKIKTLLPGAYVYNILNNQISVRMFDLNVTTITPQNQELLTKDKVTLRINFWANYQIISIDKILEKFDKNLEEILRNNIQMALRAAISNKTLDEVLTEKDDISQNILQYLKENEALYGITFLDSGIKDIILPGEIRDIMNTVLIAEKKAQANVITRREETASTRSLLNTAKLMEENAILYRLKELEMLEHIFEKVGSINISGNVLESLETMLGNKKKN